MKQSHGLFDIDTFLTIFYDVDIHEFESGLMDVVNNLTYASNNLESFHVRNIIAFKDLLDINLLHEEIHYWQAMTSPVTILNYLNISKLLLCNANKLRFRQVISDCFPTQPNEIYLFQYIYSSHRMNFEAPRMGRQLFKEIYSLYKQYIDTGHTETWPIYTRMLKDRIEKATGKNIYEYNAKFLNMKPGSYNVVSEEQPMAMPFIGFPHIEKDKFFLGYGGLLDYFDMVYFTGDNLMESYAMVNEYVAKGEPIPEYDVSKGESNRYLGVYEVYRRMHANRYSSERDLAISFLAIVDICFTTDPLHDHSEDYAYNEDFRQENVSIPYRFGKLIYRAQGFKPFTNVNIDELQSDIENWQDEFCAYQGFYMPELCIKHTIEELLFVLINDFCCIGFEFSDSLAQAFGMLRGEDSGWDERFDIVATELNKAYKWHLDNNPGNGISIQHHMILSMVNAMYFRLKNRGKMVVSALFANEVRWSIEPALYVVGGQYACNQFGALKRFPLNDYNLAVYPPLENMVLKDMALTGDRSCGFKESFYPCRFTENGYGCPLVGLTTEEREKRKHTMMPDDWCHYTRLMNIMTKKD